MAYKTDIEIAQEAELLPISAVAASLGIPEDAVENYGRYKAKIDPRPLRERPEKEKPPPRSAWPTASGRSAKTPLSPCGNPLWVLCSASRAAPPAAATPR